MSDANDTETVTSRAEASPKSNSEIEPSEEDEDARRMPEEIKVPSMVPSEHEEAQTFVKSEAGDGGKEGDKNESQIEGPADKTEGKTSRASPPPRSRCRTRSRDTRQCKKHFREMIGKYENRNDELEQRETDLRQRLEMLECSMPAVMVWNIWRMAQGAPVSHLRDVVEKQFLEPTGGFPKCPSSPSQHWDCRVREVEAERKQARHRAEQARQVYAAKGEALQVQKRQIEEARKLQEERKLQIAGLEEEVKRLQDKLKQAQGDENSCQTGECGEIRCRDAWLRGAASVSSIHSTDLECLARLQDLAEAELCMKRQIADLERRECAYMRTLQQADEMWGKMEDDNASSLGDMREQLEAKIAANQQLADRIVELEDEIEKLRMQLSKVSAALDEYTEKSFVDVGLGDVDVSTKEKIEQTDDEVMKLIAIDEGGMEEVKVPEISAVEFEEEKEIQEWQDEATKDTMIEGVVGDEEPDYEQTESPSKISTAEESVQAKAEIEETGTQSMIEELGLKKESFIEEETRVVDEKAVAVPEVSTEYSVEEKEKENAGAEETEETKPVGIAENLHLFEDKGSLAHLLKAPTEDKDTEISVAENDVENSVDGNESFGVTSGQTSRVTVEVAPESFAETAFIPVTNSVAETPSKPALEPIGKTSSAAFSEEIPAAPLSTSPVHHSNESLIETTVKGSPKPKAESTTEATASPVHVTALEAVDAPTAGLKIPEVADESSVQKTEVEITLSEDTLTLSIETLLAWHNVAACVQKLISICPQCSSSSKEVGNTLKEIRNLLGKKVPDLAEIVCPHNIGGVENSVAVPQKKGPCICKPRTCPLEGIPAATPPQTSVQIQTVVDGQSQTLMSAKKPSGEIKSPRTSKGSTKTRGEVKLTSIEEGTETDLETPRARSISGVRDEATVTVGDIASQTESIRRVSSGTKDEGKTCVCPTGVCPKENPKPPPCGECKPGKSFISGKRSQNKEYRSTADAILAPAIKVLSSNESDSGSPVTRTENNNDANSESGSVFACCLCGNPASPVASMKITSALRSTKSSLQSKGKPTSDISKEDFLCCACKVKATSGSKPKSSMAGRSSEKSVDSGRVSARAKPAPETVKTSCSRDVCCPCSNESETHISSKPLSDSTEVSKSKIKPETKDVCCLAKISRDKVLRSEGRRRKDKDSVKVVTPSVSHSSSAQMSTTSSTYKSPTTKESSDSNVCCSSLEQVVSMMKKKGKGTRCACDSQEGKDQKEECVCEENGSPKPKEPLKTKQGNSKVSCLCTSPKLFDEC